MRSVSLFVFQEVETLGKLGCLAVILLCLGFAILVGVVGALGGLLTVAWNFVVGSGLHGPAITIYDGIGTVTILGLVLAYLTLRTRLLFSRR